MNTKQLKLDIDRELYEIGSSVAKNFLLPNVPFAKNEYETFEDFEIVRETEAAYLLVIRDSAQDGAVWVPKTVCEIHDRLLYVKTWFCRKEEII